MRSLDGGSRSGSAVTACPIAPSGLSHSPLDTRQLTPERSSLATLSAEQTRQNSWWAIEIIANRHNRCVESYLQRRRHRPWRNRGS